MAIHIVKGDALQGPFIKPTILVQCNNDLGIMGSGIAGSIAHKYPQVNQEHIDWQNAYFEGNTKVDPFVLGQIQICNAEPNFYICNLIGQRSVGTIQIDGEEVRPVKYESIREGLLRLRGRVRAFETKNNVEIELRAPLMGAGLAGGTISETYEVIYQVFQEFDFTIYAFSEQDYVALQQVHEQITGVI